MNCICLNLTELVEEADRRFHRNWASRKSYEDGKIMEMDDGHGWHRSQTEHRLQIRDESGSLVFDRETVDDITPDFISVSFRAEIPANPLSGRETRIVENEARIGFGVTGFGCGSLADVATFDRELRKVVKRLRKAGDGHLQIDLARYGRDRNRNLEQMSFDSWETSMSGDITEECVYLRPDTRYTNEVRDRVLVDGSLEEMGI